MWRHFFIWAGTGIVWNNGKGYFSRKTKLPQHKNWGSISEVSASDLDNDGDLDIVYSRAGELYVGTAIQIIENLGNKKFKDHGIFPLVEAPANFTTTSEGNVWNDFIENIMFRDLDKDGDIDIYLASGSHKTNGMVMLNHGDFSFELLHPHAAMSLNVLAKNEDLRKKAETVNTAQRKKIEAAELKVAIAKRKVKVAAAKAKRVAEKIAKTAETDPIEDEIAAFEAELEAELSGQ